MRCPVCGKGKSRKQKCCNIPKSPPASGRMPRRFFAYPTEMYSLMETANQMRANGAPSWAIKAMTGFD